MTKATLIKYIGTAASAVIAGGALFFPAQYRELALGVAGCVLCALHIPRPGDVKVSP